MPRWAHNKMPLSAKKRYFELLREGVQGRGVLQVNSVDAWITVLIRCVLLDQELHQ